MYGVWSHSVGMLNSLFPYFVLPNGRLLKTNPEYDLCNVKAGCTWTEAGMLEGVAIVGRILSYMTTVRPIKYNIEQQIHMSHH